MKVSAAAPLLALALGSCDRSTPPDETPPVFAGEMVAAGWVGGILCEGTGTFTGVPYEGWCDGCTYAFSVELTAPEEPCGSLPAFGWDGRENIESLTLWFGPLEGVDPIYYQVHHEYWVAHNQYVEDVVHVADEDDLDLNEGGPFGDYLTATNAMRGQSTRFDGSTLGASWSWTTAGEALIEEHLWEECGLDVAEGTEGVASVPADALAVEAPDGLTRREWRFVAPVAVPGELRAAAVQPMSSRRDEGILVYLADPDGCLVSEGPSQEDCPTADDVCASAAIDAALPGAWSVVVAVEGSASGLPVSFDVWATLDGTAVPLLPQEAELQVWSTGKVESGQYWWMVGQVEIPGGASAEVPDCDLAEVARAIAGPDAVDCGTVPPWGDRTDVDACTVRSFTQGAAFQAVYEYEGMTRGATRATVGTGTGVYLLTTRPERYNPTGPLGAQQIYCEEPLVMRGGAGKPVVGCPHVGGGASLCFDEECQPRGCYE